MQRRSLLLVCLLLCISFSSGELQGTLDPTVKQKDSPSTLGKITKTVSDAAHQVAEKIKTGVTSAIAATNKAAQQLAEANAASAKDLCWPLIVEDSYSNAKKAFSVIRSVPDSFGNYREGDKKKNEPDRCHAGMDLHTGNLKNKATSEGRVVAIADGVVSAIVTFKQCTAGWDPVTKVQVSSSTQTYGIFVYHESLKMSINYGEANKIYVQLGDKVTKGQILSQNTACGMLHIELYSAPSADKAVTANVKWPRPSTMSKDTNCVEDKAFFASDFPLRAPLMDPRDFLKKLADNNNAGCPAPPLALDKLTDYTDKIKENAKAAVQLKKDERAKAKADKAAKKAAEKADKAAKKKADAEKKKADKAAAAQGKK